MNKSQYTSIICPKKPTICDYIEWQKEASLMKAASNELGFTALIEFLNYIRDCTAIVERESLLQVLDTTEDARRLKHWKPSDLANWIAITFRWFIIRILPTEKEKISRMKMYRFFCTNWSAWIFASNGNINIHRINRDFPYNCWFYRMMWKYPGSRGSVIDFVILYKL